MLDEKNAASTPETGITDPMKMRDTDTGSMKRMAAESSAQAPASQNNQARRTIKLKPLSAKKESAAATTQAPAAPPPDNDETVSMQRTELEEEATLKMQKPAVPPPISAVPGTKQTIKLRPSSLGSAATPAAAAPSAERPASAPTIKLTPKTEAEPEAVDSTEEDKTVAMAKQTIKLVPKKAESTPQAAVTAAAPAAAPGPSSPTISIDETSKLKPSDPTIKMGATPPPSEAQPQAPAKAKLTIKRHAGEASASIPSAPAASSDMGAGKTAKGTMAPEEASEEEETAAVAGADEPSMAFALVACFSLILVGYLMFMFLGQYANQWMDKDINIPGCTDRKSVV